MIGPPPGLGHPIDGLMAVWTVGGGPNGRKYILAPGLFCLWLSSLMLSVEQIFFTTSLYLVPTGHILKP